VPWFEPDIYTLEYWADKTQLYESAMSEAQEMKSGPGGSIAHLIVDDQFLGSNSGTQH
jgi:hypothetical protein